jgi:hypothetical protein
VVAIDPPWGTTPGLGRVWRVTRLEEYVEHWNSARALKLQSYFRETSGVINSRVASGVIKL